MNKKAVWAKPQECVVLEGSWRMMTMYWQGGSRRFCSLFREPVDNLSPEERDARTVFCMQLAARIRPRDLEDFFSAVGKVNLFPLLVVSEKPVFYPSPFMPNSGFSFCPG